MSSYFRYDKGVILAPVVRFAHADSGRTVTFIGAMHFGEPGYFDEVRERIEKIAASGGLVLAETGLMPQRWPDDVSRELEELRHLIGTAGAAMAAFYQHVFGWVPQMNVLPLAPSWIDCDMEPMEVIRRLGVDTLKHRFTKSYQAAGAGNITDPRTANKVAFKQLIVYRALASNNKRVQKILAEADPMDCVVMDARNIAVMEAVEHHAAHDLVVLYGAGHLPALSTALTERGYAQLSCEWLPVGKTPKIRLIRRSRYPRPRTLNRQKRR